MNSNLHIVCNGEGRPIVMLLSEGQMSDRKGARLVLDALPPARSLIADRGYDSVWFRDALAAKGIAACIPSSRSRKRPYPYDKAIYRQQRNSLEDWMRRWSLRSFPDALRQLAVGYDFRSVKMIAWSAYLGEPDHRAGPTGTRRSMLNSWNSASCAPVRSPPICVDN